eukprot:TRINITY_DN167_c0_g3_i1.p1 TRINITY_DN167_c0_g3~~TRINITY_DN167_c0_g3_i1.p1  ORF type:complete len:188 (+),score=51.67 TRINITY_DN167_c0_g3_i1:170-733(+)
MAAYSVRSASRREDFVGVFRLVRSLAVYEKEPDAVVLDEETFIRDGMGRASKKDDESSGQSPLYSVFVVESTADNNNNDDNNNHFLGFALFYTNYSTWTGKCIYLEDLFVREESRGKGIGSSLLQALIGHAHSNDFARVTWQVLDWNKPSIDFYDRIGGEHMKEWWTYRMDRDRMLNYLTAQQDKPV